MSDACRRRFDAVLVWKIDRFGRSLKHLVNSLAELAALGVAFVSLRDNLDLSTPSGRLMFQIIGAMAEFERALIQERVRAGIKERTRQREATRKTARDCGRLTDCVSSRSWQLLGANPGRARGLIEDFWRWSAVLIDPPIQATQQASGGQAKDFADPKQSGQSDRSASLNLLPMSQPLITF
jgi:resolvase-like protein